MLVSSQKINLQTNKILVTGCAGFIGFHLVKRLVSQGCHVIGLDNLNDYYDRSLKIDRLEILKSDSACFKFYNTDLCDLDSLKNLFQQESPLIVCNLAAQAGVRYSLTNPFAYQKSNMEGFMNILQLSKESGCVNFVYASSSSVYGSNEKFPFSEDDRTDTPVSLYAATKKSNELIAHSYSHIFKLPTTGLRFFTVYGPWGRPDMAIFKFTKSIIEGTPLELFNHGKMIRDFTYIDDIVDGVVAALERPHCYEIFNLGAGRPVHLEEFIAVLEKTIGKRAIIHLCELQQGDVIRTQSETSRAHRLLGYGPKIAVTEGVPRFVDWYRSYYRL